AGAFGRRLAWAFARHRHAGGRSLAGVAVGSIVAAADGIVDVVADLRSWRARAGLVGGATLGVGREVAIFAVVAGESLQSAAFIIRWIRATFAGREDRNAGGRGFAFVAVGHAVAAADRRIDGVAGLRDRDAGALQIGAVARGVVAVVTIFARIARQALDAAAHVAVRRWTVAFADGRHRNAGGRGRARIAIGDAVASANRGVLLGTLLRDRLAGAGLPGVTTCIGDVERTIFSIRTSIGVGDRAFATDDADVAAGEGQARRRQQEGREQPQTG